MPTILTGGAGDVGADSVDGPIAGADVGGRGVAALVVSVAQYCVAMLDGVGETLALAGGVGAGEADCVASLVAVGGCGAGGPAASSVASF